MSKDDVKEGMQAALEGANARSARRLAWLLDRILPLARQTFAENEPLPDFMIEAEETTIAILRDEPLLGEPIHIEASDEDLAETHASTEDRSDTLEGSLFRAARLIEKLNAHRIAGLEPPPGASLALDRELAALKHHLDGVKPFGLLSRLKTIISDIFP